MTTGTETTHVQTVSQESPALPLAPLEEAPPTSADVGRYIEHLVEPEGKTLATARLRLAAIAAAHRPGGHPAPTSRPLVKATMVMRRTQQ